MSVTLPDGNSTTKYTYQGNWTTVVDAAGKWKQYEADIFGNTLFVVVPDPYANPLVISPPATPSTTAPRTLLTAYGYDSLDHLVAVSMTRGAVTQTRAFNYDPTTQRLTSESSPETETAGANGISSYTYNADGTVKTRTDPKNQITSYTYDSYQRVTRVTHGGDANQTASYY